MENNIEIKINVINQLKLLKNSTFKDILCFIDENIQNAQRAKAENVYFDIDIYDNTIEITNDGDIIEDFQVLFSIAESGWKDEDVKSENPFGTGFFSNIAVSNNIEIYSGDKVASFRIDEMIENNSIQIPTKNSDEYVDGVKIVLNNFDFESVNDYLIKQRIEDIGMFAKDIDIYLNNNQIEKKDLTEPIYNYKLYTTFNNDQICGWLALVENDYSYSSHPRLFYKGREVKELDKLYYLHGNIHMLDDNLLDLRSPDRKDIIENDKYEYFIEMIKEIAENFCNEILIDGESNINNAISSFNQYANLNHSKVKNDIEFNVFDLNKNEYKDYLDKIALSQKESYPPKTFEEFELYLDKKSVKIDNDTDEINIVTASINEPSKNDYVNYDDIEEDQDDEDDYEYVESSYSGGYRRKKERNRKYSKLSKIKKDNLPKFYVEFSKIEEFSYKINLAKHYGLNIIVSRNKAEDRILQSMKDSDNVFHISYLKENIELNGNVSCLTLSKKEKRALMILDLFSKACGFEENIFTIGNVMVIKNVSVDILNKEYSEIKDEIVVFYDKESNKIFVDRSIIEDYDLQESDDEELTIGDYKFILFNFKRIIKVMGLIPSIFKDVAEEDILSYLSGKYLLKK